MKTFFRNMSSGLFALLAAFALALAQSGAQAQPGYSFSQRELDQMLAPIALYPDALLSQILMASTYPLEVIEAARWANARPGVSGDAAVRAAETEDWDPSVKSLVAFPEVLARMGENPQWTQSLGGAFLDQQSQVMDTVQALRRRAQAAGNLRSDDRVSVIESGPSLLLQPFDPQVVYLPYYDPLVVYGSWWWPAYPPVYWRPWAGYFARPGYARGYYWGPPIGVSVGFFFGAIDWTRRQLKVVHVNDYYYRHSVAMSRAGIANRAPGRWRHEPEQRRGIAYRGIEAQQRFVAASTAQGQGNRVRQAEPRRSDLRVDAGPAAPPAIGSEARFDHRRDTLGTVQSAPTAPVMRAAPVPQRAPAVHPAPVVQAAPASSGNRQAARHEPGARHEVRQASAAAARQEPRAKAMARLKTAQ